MKKKLKKEFIEFLREFRIVTAAIGFILALAINQLVISLVDDMIMPWIDPLIRGGTWETASLSIGQVNLLWGNFLSNILHLGIVFIVLFVLIKKVIKYKPLKA